VVAAFLLKIDKSTDDGDLAAATAQMEANKGKKSSVSGMLGGSAAASTGPIHSIVFACDAGMGSSAMGASVLRKKVQGAGFADVTVVNKAISNLRDDVDLVVTHRDLTDRARSKSPSAAHVSVDNFMGSPRYDEIVELLRERNGSGSGTTAAAAAAAPAGAVGGGLLARESIVLDASGDKAAAIQQAGELLVAAGSVDESYVRAMHERETSVSTYMGNLLAIPHGTNEAKPSIRRSAISFVRFPGGVDWNGKEVRFVIGIAGAGDDHLALLARIAEVFSDTSQVARLEQARTADDVLAVLGAMQPA
jgi:PTS system mannitol-specific IIC component